MIQTYFEIREAQRSILEFKSSCPERFASFLQTCWNLKLAFAVLEESSSHTTINMRHLELAVSKHLEHFMRKNKACLDIVRKYLDEEYTTTTTTTTDDFFSLCILSLVLVFFEIPNNDPRNTLKNVVSAVKRGDPESLFGTSKVCGVRPCAVVKIMNILS